MSFLAELDGESEPVARLGACRKEGGVDISIAAVTVLQLLAQDEAEAVLGAQRLQAACVLLAEGDNGAGGGPRGRLGSSRGRGGPCGGARLRVHPECSVGRLRGARRRSVRRLHALVGLRRLRACRKPVRGHHAVRRLHAVHVHVRRESVGHPGRGGGEGGRRHRSAERLVRALALALGGLALALAFALAIHASDNASRQGALRLLGLSLLPVREHYDELLAIEDLVVRPHDRLLRLRHRGESHEAEAAAVAVLVCLYLHGHDCAVGFKVRADLRRSDALGEVPHAELDALLDLLTSSISVLSSVLSAVLSAFLSAVLSILAGALALRLLALLALLALPPTFALLLGSCLGAGLSGRAFALVTLVGFRGRTGGGTRCCCRGRSRGRSRRLCSADWLCRLDGLLLSGRCRRSSRGLRYSSRCRYSSLSLLGLCLRALVLRTAGSHGATAPR
mmetsp:Transcript_61539/g.161647  ORF Transcript_61539/g.161647 Transcript_61539/m.161647 type:complete len:450 (-) Transcript_61539:24-1373(-)